MSTAEWYFRMGGEVSGPFDLDTMRGFRRSGLLKAESEVSLLSLPGQWIAAGETEVFRDPPATTAPAMEAAPATPTAAVPVVTDDRYAWALAVAALVMTLFEAQAFRLGIAPFYEEWFLNWGWLAYLFVNGLLANADIRRNRKLLSGRQVALVLLVPAYFWVRRRRAGSSSAMLAVNLVTLVLSAAITFGKVPIVGGTNMNSCFAPSLHKIVKDLVESPSFTLRGRVAMIRSVRETSYDGRSRVCFGEIVTDSNVRHRIEFSTETTAKDGEEYIRVRAAD